MYEATKLLNWAANRLGRSPRRITFFAALAEWKHDPEPAFDMKLDAIELSEMLRLVLGAATGDSVAAKTLADMLREKVDRTSEVNVDVSGLDRLYATVESVLKAPLVAVDTIEPTSRITESLRRALAAALEETRQAVEHRGQPTVPIRRAAGCLRIAIEILDPTDAGASVASR